MPHAICLLVVLMAGCGIGPDVGWWWSSLGSGIRVAASVPIDPAPPLAKAPEPTPCEVSFAGCSR